MFAILQEVVIGALIKYVHKIKVVYRVRENEFRASSEYIKFATA